MNAPLVSVTQRNEFEEPEPKFKVSESEKSTAMMIQQQIQATVGNQRETRGTARERKRDLKSTNKQLSLG
jgi:hypothetical protein